MEAESLEGTRREDIRNIAIIAHVDHGKTTLVDGLLRQSGIFRENQRVVERVMDSNDLERERGITILSKNTAVNYGHTRINIVDTPGHADFGGEVERVLRMVEGALLLVDAFDGPMAQTKFVLKKALQVGLRIIVVINKMDRPQVRPDEVLNEIFDLFVELEAGDWQLDFPVVYTSSLQGRATLDFKEPGENLQPLFHLILNEIPAPQGDPRGKLQLQINTLDYDDYVGRIGIGRILHGSLKAGQAISLCKREGQVETHKISKLWTHQGLERREAEEVYAGDIVAVAGIKGVYIGETICHPENPSPLPMLSIDEPTVRIDFMTNDSPFAGKEGKYVTSRQLRSRLLKEAETNVSLKVEETDSPDTFLVSGRGDLHLGIVVENMRREGYELQISRPSPILKEVEGELWEPYERVYILLPRIYSGSIIESLGLRRGEMINLQPAGEYSVKLEFVIPARGLMGFRSQLLTEARGEGIMHHLFDGYRPWKGSIPGRRHGVLVAAVEGEATAYGIHQAEDRGALFIQPGDRVYGGMIVGENSRPGDLDINPCKKKQLTNIRASAADEGIRLTPPVKYTLEEAMEFIQEDELIEVTPGSIRMRKKTLDRNQREKALRRS
ncbi:MAG: translational GTPase TypA [Candidatus Syntrophonatronum acetioxidans]|uniref:Large ribosomal subunit assembly factor BipA n=1 Tax=Candidatus Syntrophonatronum acetioxidans TaxID=1795816 RepID=A0A424YD87_9FIRM|nr:MAG: translational GTPase TypA [Candidatus Syntrophonatronum acetioxidans]